MLKKLGSHPDNPYPARSVEDALAFSTDRVICPNCGKQSGHQFEGQCSLARKSKTGQVELFDAVCVKCSRCDRYIPVFCTSSVPEFGPISGQPMRRNSLQFAAGMSSADGGCQIIMAVGLPPHTWLPKDIIAVNSRVDGDDDNEG
jgi:hypothetical protein